MSKRSWWLTKDGDRAFLEMYEKHYSCYAYKDSRERKLFIGPGEKLALRTWSADAVFAWRKFIDDSGQEGINCAVFRNESQIRSSRLIREAQEIADYIWPNSRHYTYVDAQAVASRNPGYCFLMAGWKRLKYRTGSGKMIFESLPCQR